MNEEKYTSFHNQYMPNIIKWGRILNLLMVPAMFLPVLFILIFFDVDPNMAGAISGSIAYISFSLPYYFTELIALGPILHVPGTYIAFIAGNSRNICAVATSSALDVTNAQTGTPEATIMATIATAVSVIMKFVIVLVIALTGSYILSVVPAGSNYLLNLPSSLLIWRNVDAVGHHGCQAWRHPACDCACRQFRLPAGNLFVPTCRRRIHAGADLRYCRLPDCKINVREKIAGRHLF